MSLKRNLKKIRKYQKFIIPVLLIIVIILLFAYGNIISKHKKITKFANEESKVYENNQEQVFKIKNIIICSSANATDLSPTQNLQDLSIYQYTDIAVYIDNGEELTNKNTIKELYIDNISLEGATDIGKKSLKYKNISKLGLKKETTKRSKKTNKNESNTTNTQNNETSSSHNIFESLIKSNENVSTVNTINTTVEGILNETSQNTDPATENTINETQNETIQETYNTVEENENLNTNNDDNTQTTNNNESTEATDDENATENKDNDKIQFNIVYTNQENEAANYDEPTFYTDCSNPITLEYLNNDIVTNYKMDENKSVVFDGSILKEAGISTESLACKVKFKINIVNNQNEKYSCWVNFDIPLEDIYEGTTMKGKTTNNQKYVFFREK